MFGYSTMTHILLSKSKQVSDPKGTSYLDIVTNEFRFNTSVDYTFQHCYRSRNISFIFKKEFLLSLIILVIFIFYDL